MSVEWRYRFTSSAKREFKRLDPPVQRRVIVALDALVRGNAQTGDVRKLAGGNEWRLRVGDWRVRFIRDDEERAIVVLHVLPRGRAYER